MTRTAAIWKHASILVEGYVCTPVAFLRLAPTLGLSPGETVFVLHVLTFKWDDDDAYPSVDTLAERMNTSTRMVRKYARQLERKGYLRRIPRAGRSNRWCFDGLMDALADHLETQEGGTFSDVRAELLVS